MTDDVKMKLKCKTHLKQRSKFHKNGDDIVNQSILSSFQHFLGDFVFFSGKEKRQPRSILLAYIQ